MAESNLMLHTGGRLVSLEQLRELKAPPPEGRWYPLSHATVLDAVKGTLLDAGYQVRAEKLAVTSHGERFFGTLDLDTPVATGVSLAVGVRNSVDKSFPLGFCAGNRVFVCDNLAFRSELLVKRKHTRFGEKRFSVAIAQAVTSLRTFKEVEETRIKTMMATELKPEVADSPILQSFEKGIISSLQLPRIIKEWRAPSFEEFEARTAWSLMNAFTLILHDRATKNPTEFVAQTMRLNALLGPKGAETEPELVTPA